MGNKTWLYRFPGASNAEDLRQLLEGFLPDIVAVRRDERLAGPLSKDLKAWRSDVDTTGIPYPVVQQADRYIEIARAALGLLGDVEAAEGALLQASRLFTR